MHALREKLRLAEDALKQAKSETEKKERAMWDRRRDADPSDDDAPPVLEKLNFDEGKGGDSSSLKTAEDAASKAASAKVR